MSTASTLTVDSAKYKIGDQVKANFLGVEYAGTIQSVHVGEDPRTNVAGIYYSVAATEPRKVGFIVHEDNVSLQPVGGKRKGNRRRTARRTRRMVSR